MLRVLRLNSPVDDDQGKINCCLETVHLDTIRARGFVALSYTWGDPYGGFQEDGTPTYTADRDCEIVCNGHPVQVTRNLLDFLETAKAHGSFPHETTPIWIDAVCINQEDLDERASQVRMMTWIYSCAQEVFIWLGKPVDHIYHAKRLLWALKKHDIRDLHKYQPKNPEDLENTNVFLKTGATSRVAWTALGDLFSRAWFGRIWVVQEIAFGGTAKIYFGDEFIKYKHIDHFAECYEHSWWVEQYLHRVFDHHDLHLPADEAKVTRIRENMHAIGHIQQSNERVGMGLAYNYFNMIMFSKAFDAGDPRDKIYALLGMCSSIDNTGMPDYRLDAAKLYPEIFAMTLAESGTMPFSLHTPRDKSEKIPDLPSWCPDYSARDYSTADFTATHAAGHTAGHLWKGGVNVRWAVDKRKFGVKNAPIDHIALVGESMDEFLNSGNCPGWIKILSSMPEKYKKKQQSCMEVFWRLWVRDREMRKYEARPMVGECFARWLVVQAARIICSTPAGEQRAAIKSSFMKSFEELSKLDSTGLMPRPDELGLYLGPSRPEDAAALTPKSSRKQPEGIGMESYWHYDDQSPRVCDKLFITKEDGYIGIGPRTMREGDLMCIFCGAPSCFIIRASEEHKGCYTFVGPAYVHGLMDEEEVKAIGFGVAWATLI
ncbi:heterokaryon incompatibility protein-domain-containing protein [Paraphoma chrysanthemicola]|nr:heterokaryon incompatibility protein-domain-containing protein [Paraphoma chrysanthemicola]